MYTYTHTHTFLFKQDHMEMRRLASLRLLVLTKINSTLNPVQETHLHPEENRNDKILAKLHAS